MSKPTLKEKAYIELRNLILKGSLEPGEFLTERSLVERLNMSRTPIRSALERLEAEGFVKQSPKQGIVVEELSIKKAVDIYDLRMALESYVGKKLAVSQLPEKGIYLLRQNLAEQKKYMETGDYTGFVAKDYEFHLTLVRLYDNKEIINIIEQIQDRLYQIAIKVLRKDAERIVVSYEDHQRIVENILNGEGEKAATEIVNHLDFGKRILIQ
ncbi:GntR family transcriptional regulator [Numidum massiliense]|uniref:GntR family transcriptional regulator n=1 Tax=Numidum massiliense TaxID=1522315 RepID=UPI0006D57EC6|nr:GntR family transcriptional regulator [Numidum massiliense]